jgi:hypothetical protein
MAWLLMSFYGSETKVIFDKGGAKVQFSGNL